MNGKKWKKIRDETDIIQAELTKGLLNAQGIQAIISREGYESALGITGHSLTHIEILVPGDQIENANKILADLDAGKFQLDDDNEE